MKVLVVWLLALGACSANSKTDTPTMCPDSIADNKETWSYSGEDQVCQAIADSANMDASNEMCPGEMAVAVFNVQDGMCVATLVRECGDTKINLSCHVASNGEADCQAHVVSGQVTCDFMVKER